jgi:hypothetical protein
MMKSRRRRRTVVRALSWRAEVEGSASRTRSTTVGLLGGARKAMLKSVSCVGEEGVTIIAGSDDFSDMSGKERSRGAGMSV